MQRTGVANLPLHPGKCPAWLFERMRKLAEAITEAIVYEYDENELLNKLANPHWFQAFGCVLGFDFHSSGLTTTVCGALKEAVNKENFGIGIAGGKGKVSRKALTEIDENKFNLTTAKIERLKYASRITAKVDNNLIQDNYQLYTHSFIYTKKASWAVIQQGLNRFSRYARRYHWLSENVQNFVSEPHSAICCDSKEAEVLDMTAKESEESRKVCVDLVNDNPLHLRKYLKTNQMILLEPNQSMQTTLTMKPRHQICLSDLSQKTIQSLQKAYELQPQNYEELVALKGVGPKSVRALALVSELIYGTKLSWKDPAKYSWAFGGKDGYPRPVERKLMDSNIAWLKDAIKNAKLGEKDKLNAIQRLNNFIK
jgi:hypothetical protein